ncbi:hypothetical protein MMJ48_00520 [Enterococcus cecorum]|nr:hypothetical protein [Enterococcus cecorum]
MKIRNGGDFMWLDVLKIVVVVFVLGALGFKGQFLTRWLSDLTEKSK